MSGYHLAQINVGKLKAPIDAPETADFKNNLDRVNTLAEASPGFVWRLTGEGNDATDLVAFSWPSGGSPPATSRRWPRRSGGWPCCGARGPAPRLSLSESSIRRLTPKLRRLLLSTGKPDPRPT